MKRRRLNILLIDDSEQDYTITYGLLTEIEGWRFNLEWVTTYGDALEHLARTHYDVCLLGHRLDDKKGLKFVHHISKNGLEVPLILLTRPEDRTLAMEAMKADATVDYLVKGEINALSLKQSIRYGIKYKEMAEWIELQVAEHTLELTTANDQLQKEVDQWQQAEHILRERERRYRQLFDFGVDGVEILDSRGVIVDCNVMYQRLLGGSREEIVGKHTTAFTTDEIEEVFVEKLLPLLKQGGHIEGESELICLDGSTRRMWRRFQTMHDEDGVFKGIVVYNRDITERMQAVEQLSDLALAIEQCPIALLLADGEGVIQYVNFKFTELTGHTYEEVVGQPLQIVKPESQPVADYEAVWTKVVTGEEWQDEFITQTKHGDTYWEVISISPMYDVEGEITSFIVAKTDITSYKQAEDAAMSSQRRLGGLATEHINDLTAANERLEREIAERRKAEEALLRSQIRLKAQYKGIPVPTYTWQRSDDDFILVDYNDAAEASDRGNLADLVGRTASRTFRDPQVLADFAQCYAEKNTVEREAPYQLLATGEMRYFVTTYNFVPPDLIIVHIQDITEHKQAETELMARHDQLEATTTKHVTALTEATAALQAESEKRKQLEQALQEKEEYLKQVISNGTTRQPVEPAVAIDQMSSEEAASDRVAELSRLLAAEIAQREQVEEELRQSETRLQEVASNIDDRLREQYRGIPIPTYSWQLIADEFVMVDFNDAAAQEMAQIVDFLGKTASEVFKNRPQVLSDLARCYNERRTVVHEGPYKRVTTGETRYFVTTYNFAPPTLVIVHIQDITEQKEMEAEFEACRQHLKELTATHTAALTEVNEALQEEIIKREQAELALAEMKAEPNISQSLQQEVASHEGATKLLQESRIRLKAQYKGIPVPTYCWQRVRDDFMLIDYNDAAEKTTNGNIVEFMGKKVHQIFKDRPQVLADFETCFAEKKMIKREAPYRLVTTGELKYFVTTYSFVPPNLIIVYIQDITEHKHLEEALKMSEEQVELLCRFSPSAKLIFVNDAYCWYFGQDRERLIGRTLPFVYHEDLEAVKAHFASLTLENPVGTIEYRIFKSDKDVRWQQWINRAIFDKEGRLIEIRAGGRDITSRKQI